MPGLPASCSNQGSSKPGFEENVRGLRGLELCARRFHLLDLMPAMKLDGGGPQLPPVTSGERKFEGFWPIESNKKRRGNASFSPVVFLGFPRCRSNHDTKK